MSSAGRAVSRPSRSSGFDAQAPGQANLDVRHIRIGAVAAVTDAQAVGGDKTVDAYERVARELMRAAREARSIPPLVESHPGLGIRDAYEIQRHVRRAWLDSGARLAGRKVGLTSQAMQDMLGVDQPDFGFLLESMLLPSGASIPVSELIAPRVEAEIAFHLAKPLAGPGVEREQVLEAIEAVAPALEVIDSRVADWRITIVDTIADNASSGKAVFGERRPPGDLDLAAEEMTLEVDGEQVSGSGRAVLGSHPADAVAWLANTLADFGERIEAGEVVIPGALARALPVGAGSRAVAEFSTLGEVSAIFE